MKIPQREELEIEVDNVNAKLQKLKSYKRIGVVTGAIKYNKSLLVTLNKKLVKHNERYKDEKSRK